LRENSWSKTMPPTVIAPPNFNIRHYLKNWTIGLALVGAYTFNANYHITIMEEKNRAIRHIISSTPEYAALQNTIHEERKIARQYYELSSSSFGPGKEAVWKSYTEQAEAATLRACDAEYRLTHPKTGNPKDAKLENLFDEYATHLRWMFPPLTNLLEAASRNHQSRAHQGIHR
jgi:hypothetical protein